MTQVFFYHGAADKLAAACALLGGAYAKNKPVLVFARMHFGALTLPLASAALILSLVLAWASWRYVEAPFRKRGPQARISRARLVAIFAPATVLAMTGAPSREVFSAWLDICRASLE